MNDDASPTTQPQEFAHTREPSDRHVISTHDRRKSLFLDMLGGASSNQDLMDLMEISNPECLERKVLPKTDQDPAELFLKAIVDLARQNGDPAPGSVLEARAYFHAQETIEDERLAILKRVPPANIHRMQRTENWVGDLMTGGFVVEALQQVGVDLTQGLTLMDSGCSSGSLIRTLAWAFPQSQFYGCDPVDSSIDWAQENLTFSNLKMVHQDQDPPLQLEDNLLDAATAISIYSHHGINATRRWLAEMARVLKPGGHFLITYNDLGSLHKTMEINKKSHNRYREIYCAMLETGYAFEEVWLDKDDAGNEATVKEWGNSFFTTPMFHALAAEHYTVAFHGRRLNQNRQDVVILKRR